MLFALRTNHPDTGYYTFVWILSLLAVFLAFVFTPWLAAFTETVEALVARYPDEVATLNAIDPSTQAQLQADPSNTAAISAAVTEISQTLHVSPSAALQDLITIVSPTTFFRWLHEDKAGKKPAKAGRRKRLDVRKLIVKLARENPGWGYTRVLGELRKLTSQKVSRQLWSTSCASMASSMVRRTRPRSRRN